MLRTQLGTLRPVITTVYQDTPTEVQTREACMLSRPVECDSLQPWTAGQQAPLSVGFPGKNTGVVAILVSRGSS